MKKSEINIDIFKRNIKLYKLGVSKLFGNELILYDHLNRLSSLSRYIIENRSQFLLFGTSEEEILLLYNKNSKSCLIHPSKVWNIIFKKADIGYTDAKYLLIWWMEYTLNIPISRVLMMSASWNYTQGVKLIKHGLN